MFSIEERNIYIVSKINLTWYQKSSISGTYQKFSIFEGDTMEVAITKMSSKGQIVIPAELRQDIEEGDKLLIIKNDHQLILKKANEMDIQLKEDLEFARRTEEALKRYEKGQFKSMNFDDFISEMKKW